MNLRHPVRLRRQPERHVRRSRWAAAALVVVTPLGFQTGAAVQADRAVGQHQLLAPTLSPSAPIAGEQFTVSGTLPRPGERIVVLQRRQDGRWIRVDRAPSTEAGAYELWARARDRRSEFRVIASATETRPALRSGAWTVRTVRDRAQLWLTGTTEASVASAALSPVRPGRRARLQQAGPDGVWRAASSPATADAEGRVSFDLRSLAPGTSSYRLRVGWWHGAPAYTTAAVDFVPAVPTWAVPAAPAQLVIQTEGSAPIVSKEDYIPGVITVEDSELPMQIKGRGNSTWTWEKKPYKVKLDQAASVLGMPAERDWVLLANWADRAGLRSHLAFALGRERSSLAWTPRARYVDVVLNGEPLGLYQLAEQVEAGEQRVALPDDGMLLEVNMKADEEGDPFVTTSEGGLLLVFKDPDEPSDAQRQTVQAAVTAFEVALWGDGFADPMEGYPAHVDVESFVDWYLINELFKNLDADFTSSVYLTWSPDGRFNLGPLWDFDLSVGTGWDFTAEPEGWWLRPGEPTNRWWHDDNWLTRMFEDPAFEARFASRWRELRPAVDALIQQVPAIAAVLGGSAQADWILWHADEDPDVGQVHADSYAGEVAFLQDWLSTRADWISANTGPE